MNMEQISAVYKIVNIVTNDSYIGSSKNVNQRWLNHQKPSRWGDEPNKRLYQDMQKYGVDKFRFQILAPVMPECLKQVEQEFIEMLKPTYNNYRASDRNIERYKEHNKEYSQSEKGKELQNKRIKKYQQSNKGKEVCRKSANKYRHKLCLYNGEELTFCALYTRFRRARIEHPALEAKKYLI